MLWSYLLFTFVLAATPGSTTAVVVRNTLAGGRGAGLATAAGAAIGNSSHAAAAGFGLALVVAQWPAMLTLVRAAGGAYLAWLGVASVWRAIQNADGGIPVMAAPGEPRVRPSQRSFSQGFAVNILNPSIVTFYLVVVPSFIPAGASRWWFVALAAIHVSMAFACHGAWVLGFDRVRRFFHRPAARRTLEACSGVALVGLAIRVLL
jgi:threonine/homoserine/homoserine lactone efflux protein